MFFLLLEWSTITSRLEKYIPVNNKRKLSEELAKTTSALIYGMVLIAILEFCVAVLGFWLAGTQYFWLLSILIALSAFIPGIGPGAIWIPVAIIYLFEQSYLSATIIIITGFVISIGIDLFLRARITSKGANIHPLLVLMGILGGINIFGIFGFVIGPLIVGYTIKIIEEVLE
jgi:predicted PurR-regulated permease PerM